MSSTDGPASVLTLPKGGGAIRGLGEKFSPDLHTGTGNFTVPIALPAGRNGLQPSLSLAYSTGAGNGHFGLGWTLSISGIARKTTGIPRYVDQPPDSPERDTFILSGVEDLVFVGTVDDEHGVSAAKYQPRTEGAFAEILRYLDRPAGVDYWRVRAKSGLISYYGTHPDASARPAYPNADADDGTRANTANLDRPRDIFAWHPTLTKDPFGNRIEYLYDVDAGDAGGHRWKQPLLREIRYVDYGEADDREFLVSVTLDYGDRPDAFSSYRSGFELRTSRRCRAIQIETRTDRVRPVRRYVFTYASDALTRMSQLRAIDVVGFDDEGVEARELPPLEFEYSTFDPADRRCRDFYPVTGFDLPAFSLANPSLELVDLFGHGLPDILEMNGTIRYWRNRGGGRFAVPHAMADGPGVALADPGVQLLDANGDGRADLIVTQGPLAGYYPLQFGGLWDRRSFQRYDMAPSFSLDDPEVRLIDLTGDGITDVLRSGSRLECFFSDRRDGWTAENTGWVERGPLEQFPNVNFSDPRVKWGDMCGDEMQTIALVYDANVEYWPNLGWGRWGSRLHMRNSPRLPLGYDPARVLVGDVNGDGLADLVYVDDRKVLLWINQSGNSWSDTIEIHGTPPVSTIDSVRLIDLLGSGISGVLWTKDARDAREDHYFFLDLTGGTKPYLLNVVTNNMGAVTKISYASSTTFYLQDENDPATRWRTPLPFPVQVVTRVDAIDELSGGTLTTEYRYHHGYWDGVEREFRGFGRVDRLDTESRAPAGDAIAADDNQYSPPTLTKTWFHQGAVGDDRPDWRELDWTSEFWTGDAQLLGHVSTTNEFLLQLRETYRDLPSSDRRRIMRDALRALRGNVIRTELYALDGTDRSERPYIVTEQAYGLREEMSPVPAVDRPHIFFVYPVAQRTTQWERGDDPMTTVSYTRDHDGFGNPLTAIEVGCPRGWRGIDSPMRATYLATIQRTEIATPRDAGVYIHDRVSKAVKYEIRNPPIPPEAPDAARRTLTDVLELAADPGNLRPVSEEIRFYDDDPARADDGAFVGASFGVIGSYGAVTRSEVLAMTPEIIADAYGPQPPPYLGPDQPFVASAGYPAGFVQALKPLAGYVYHAAGAPYSGGYYVTSLRRRYDFHDGEAARGLVREELDPLGAGTLIEYDDPYALLCVAVTNAIGLRVSASYNYRVLQPEQVVDANGNRSEVEYSPLGLVTATWVRGKEGLDEGDIDRASTTLEYDFLAFRNGKQLDPNSRWPVFVASRRYTHHESDDDDVGEVIETREYSDGFGRVVQTRIQGERVRFGDPIFGGGDALLPPLQSDGRGTGAVGVANTNAAEPNVVVSGWQRYDNKGRVVEKWEPFFSTGWTYSMPRDSADPAQRQFGVSARMFYDAKGRITRTLNPDGSEQRVFYGIPADLDERGEPHDMTPTPWETFTYDANDNAGRTHAAASLAYRHHWNTPQSVVIDALGRTVFDVTRHRAKPAVPAALLPAIDEYRVQSVYDIQGNLVGLVDPLNRPAFGYVYDLLHRAVKVDSLDAGSHVSVLNALGQEIEHRDAKGARILRSYDALNRRDRVWARNDAAQAITLREQVEYGDDGDPNQPAVERELARSANTLGRPSRQLDEAGEIEFLAYDFKGNLVEKRRAVIDDAPIVAALNNPGGPARTFTVDWGNSPPLSQWYETSVSYDALGRAKSMQCPRDINGDRKLLVPRYNNAGALEGVLVEGAAFVEHIAYNARGQRTLVAYGNGVMTRYAYDSRTCRLVRQRTESFTNAGLVYTPVGAPLQDSAYTYDLAGNILTITEQTPGCGVRNNPESWTVPALMAALISGDALVRRFEYDPLYRLTSASGRESKNIDADKRAWSDDRRDGWNWGTPGTPSPESARDVTRTYRETYTYDAADNLLTMKHGWTRQFGMSGSTPENWDREWRLHLAPTAAAWPAATSNRCTHVGDDEPGVGQTHFYDPNGNLVRENTERHFAWDASNRLIAFANRPVGANATKEACYLYDAAGQRTKKLVRNGAGVEVTVYIDELFEHRTLGGQENNTIHVMDDRSRLALVRVGLPINGDTGPTVQYHLGDHLGSSNLVVGGDDAAANGFVNREEYFPFGETSFGTFARKRYRFSGQERDEESGLNYHSARYYLPWLARWTTVDPQGHVDGLNVYAYCRNEPLSTRDPRGMQGNEITEEQRVRRERFRKMVANLLNPKEPHPTSARAKTKDVDVETDEHDAAVVKIINGAIDAAYAEAQAQGETLTREELLHRALFDFVTSARTFGEEKTSQDLTLRDVDHYFAGRLQEWRKMIPGLKLTHPTHDPRTVKLGEGAAEVYDDLKRMRFHLFGAVPNAPRFEFLELPEDPDRPNAMTGVEENYLPAAAPGGRFWASLGGMHALQRDRTASDPVTDPTSLHITLDDVQNHRRATDKQPVWLPTFDQQMRRLHTRVQQTQLKTFK